MTHGHAISRRLERALEETLLAIAASDATRAEAMAREEACPEDARAGLLSLARSALGSALDLSRALTPAERATA